MIPLLWIALLAAADPVYVRSPFVLAERPDHLMLRDLDGDRLTDVLAITHRKIVIWFQKPDGHFDFTTPDQTLELEARAVGFDVADLDGDGKAELVLLEDGVRIVPYHLDDKRHFVRASEPLLSGLSAIVPDGLRHMGFVRDVDGDGHPDLIVPAPRTFQLYLQERGKDGAMTFKPGPQIAAAVNININAGGGRSLSDTIGESVMVPMFRLRDLNGDGRLDLVAENGDVIACYLSGKNGLPLEPTFSIDLAALRREIARPEEESFDPSNIAKGAGETVDHRAADVNHDGIEDHVIRQGQKVSLYLGTPSGVDFTHPNQVLKASGNVLAHWVTDSDDDGMLDLHILRMEDVSVAEVLLWLVKSGSLKLDLFIYRYEDGAFAKKPTRRLKFDLEIPALLGFVDKIDDLASDLMTRAQVPTTVADLTGAGHKRDGLMLKDGKVQVYLGAAPAEWAEVWGPREYWLGFLRRIGYTRERDSYTLSLEHIDQWIPLPGYELGQLLEQASVSFTLELSARRGATGDDGVRWFYARDLNADGRDDLLLLGPGTGEGDQGVFVAEVLIAH
jgi:hypothetical protein